MIASVEEDLQHPSDGYKIGSADGTHDLLRDVGPLGTVAIQAHSRESERVEAWLHELIAVGRVINGTPAAWLDPKGKRVATFGGDTEAAVEAMRDLARRYGRATISQIDGIDAHDHPIAAHLPSRGFVSGYKGFTLLPSTRPPVRENAITHR